ncbi:ATP synthase F1 subunit epsilon [Sphingomonas oryzagri]|uniref:ATP synthase epsilon chain n=1 Tax=Sphingomonas oryzagri TaxID=3042314 RepID=A0ABT6MXD0_9SPHN|nr:ATP synthase F1 subunit epsilon [Sphingomonas oryzagri]MDH7637144.1 ATP synthase F1 subunit epsilon [Sphingomonas oryzagri]
MADVHFELVTPEKKILSEDAYMVVVPGTEGDFGVLAGHAPLMSTVRDGEVLVYSSMTQIVQRVRVQGGFAEVTEKGLTILAEHAEVLSGADAATHGHPARADH